MMRYIALVVLLAASAMSFRIRNNGRQEPIDESSAVDASGNSSSDSFVEVTGTRRRCCGHRRRRYGQCTHDLKAHHRRRRQCDCESYDFGERGSYLIVQAQKMYNFRVGDTIFNRKYTFGEQRNRSISSNVYAHCQASASAAGLNWKASVKAQTGFEVNHSLSWSWYSSTEDTITNTVVNQPVCYWQEHFYAYNRCGHLKGDWAGALENDNECPPHFHVLYRKNF